MRFDARPRPPAPRPHEPPFGGAPRAPRVGRAAAPLASALALALLTHCTFPDYSFRSSEDDVSGGGRAGAAGRGAAGGPSAGAAGGPAGGAGQGAGGGSSGAGQAGAGGGSSGAGGCVENCEFVVATSANDMLSVVSDGTTAFWSELDLQSGGCTIFARPADGSGEVRVVAGPNRLPDGQAVIDLQADGDAVYGRLIDNTFQEPARAVVRVAKADGQTRVVFDFAPDRAVIGFALGEALIYAFRDNDNAPPGELVRAAKDGDDALFVTGNVFSLLGVENERALVVDNAGNVAAVRRDSNAQPAQSSAVLAADGNPFPIQGAFDGDAYYFLALGSVRRLPRGGTPADVAFLANNAGNDPFHFRADGGSLYWTNLRNVNTGIGDLHVVAKAGATASEKLVENIFADALSVRDGVAHWVSNDFKTLVGRRLR